MQSAISFLDKNTILLINFNYIDYYNNNSLINTNIDNLSHKYFKKNENSGKAVYIVIIPVVIAFAVFVILYIYIRKWGKIRSKVDEDFSGLEFKVKDSETV